MTARAPDGKPVAPGPAQDGADAAPAWFPWALSVRPRESVIDVQGCPIRFLQWGKPGGKPIVLVHGNSAHAEWWRFIAPFLAETHCIAALDLGGMGDSGERGDYTPDGFGAEISAVAETLIAHGADGPADIVAHSFGGLGAIVATHARPDLVRRLTIIDTPLHLEAGPPPWRSRGRHKRIYPTRDAAVSAFRLLPPQDCDNGYLVDFIAEHSVKQVDGGWTWRFSSNPWNYPAFGDGFWPGLAARLRALRPPVAFVRGAESALCDETMMRRWHECRGQDDVVVTVPAAHHHIMLDQPLALVGVLRTLVLV